MGGHTCPPRLTLVLPWASDHLTGIISRQSPSQGRRTLLSAALELGLCRLMIPVKWSEAQGKTKMSSAGGQACPPDATSKILEDLAQVWGGRRELNPQRPEPQSGALPIELLPPFLAIIATGVRAVRRAGRAVRTLRNESSDGPRRRIRIPWRAGGRNREDFWCRQSPDASAGA